MSFYLSLFVFILSLITGLVLMITGRNMRRDKFLLLASFHLMLLFAFIASLLLRKNDEGTIYNYFFMAFICSGVSLSGLAWRSEAPFILKIYFSFFALTLPIFLLSPSILLNFLLTMNFSGSNGPVFHLESKYFLETQKNSRLPDDVPHYKIILKKGIFHQTIKRDIIFGAKLDSVRLIEFEKGTSMLLRGYLSKITFVSSEVDSVEVKVLLRASKQGDVEYRL